MNDSLYYWMKSELECIDKILDHMLASFVNYKILPIKVKLMKKVVKSIELEIKRKSGR